MIALIQRVDSAQVIINKKKFSQINIGLLIFLGVCKEDEKKEILKFVKKIISLRIFSDKKAKMNLDLRQIKGGVMIVSQFTLCANLKKGNRPSFSPAEESAKAKKIYQEFVNEFKKEKIETQTGIFGAQMKIKLVNDGPVTLILNSKNLSNSAFV